MQIEAVTRHVHKVRRHRRDHAEPLHTDDLLRRRLDYMNHYPALVFDRDLRVNRLVGAQHPFQVITDQAVQSYTAARCLNTDFDEAFV